MMVVVGVRRMVGDRKYDAGAVEGDDGDRGGGREYEAEAVGGDDDGGEGRGK